MRGKLTTIAVVGLLLIAGAGNLPVVGADSFHHELRGTDRVVAMNSTDGNTTTQAEPDAGINSMEIIDEVDRDGDGKVSEFTIQIDADTQCFGCYDESLFGGDEKMEPKLEVLINGESIKWTEELDRDDSITKELVMDGLSDKFGAQDLDVTVKLWDDDPVINDFIDEKSTTVEFEPSDEDEPNEPPNADAGDNRSVLVNTSVELDGTNSSDPNDDSLSYTWTQLSGPEVGLDETDTATPEFTAPGVESETDLKFELTVSDGNGGEDTDTVVVTVTPKQNQAPSAVFESSPSEPTVGEEITFNASESTDPDDGIESFEWDFNNDGTIDKSGRTVTHTFDSSGEYTVSLTVADSDGATDTIEETISIKPSSDNESSDSANESSAPISLTIEDATTAPNSTVTVDFNLTNTNDTELSGPAVKIVELPSG